MEALAGVDLNLLVALGALLDTSSVTEAAAKLGVGQPAMSRNLAALRELLGDTLLVREGRGMTLTPRAEALRDPVRASLSAVELLLSAPRGFEPARDGGILRLAVSSSVRDGLLGQVLARLHAAAPGMEVRVVPALAEGPGEEPELCLWLDEGEAPPGRGWVRQEIGTVDWVVVGATEYLSPLSLDLKAYAALPHVVVDPRGDGAPDMVDEALAARGLTRRVAVRVPDVPSALAAVRGGPFVATVPRLGAMDAGVAVRPPPLPLPTARLLCCWPPRVAEDARVAWVRAELAAFAGPRAVA